MSLYVRLLLSTLGCVGSYQIFWTNSECSTGTSTLGGGIGGGERGMEWDEKPQTKNAAFCLIGPFNFRPRFHLHILEMQSL